MKKLLICIIAAMMIYSVHIAALAANDNVQVAIPQFDITLNGRQINSAHEKYPLLHYKEIVYIPITEYSEFLGISCTWNEETKSYYIKKLIKSTKYLQVKNNQSKITPTILLKS